MDARYHPRGTNRERGSSPSAAVHLRKKADVHRTNIAQESFLECEQHQGKTIPGEIRIRRPRFKSRAANDDLVFRLQRYRLRPTMPQDDFTAAVPSGAAKVEDPAISASSESSSSESHQAPPPAEVPAQVEQ